jgi:hypothetical protein
MRFRLMQARKRKTENIGSIVRRGPDIENVRGLNLAAAKLTTVQLTSLALWRKTDMIFFVKPGLAENLYRVHKEECSITCYMCLTYS